jgi:hypothetical protein
VDNTNKKPPPGVVASVDESLFLLLKTNIEVNGGRICNTLDKHMIQKNKLIQNVYCIYNRVVSMDVHKYDSIIVREHDADTPVTDDDDDDARDSGDIVFVGILVELVDFVMVGKNDDNPNDDEDPPRWRLFLRRQRLLL